MESSDPLYMKHYLHMQIRLCDMSDLQMQLFCKLRLLQGEDFFGRHTSYFSNRHCIRLSGVH